MGAQHREGSPSGWFSKVTGQHLPPFGVFAVICTQIQIDGLFDKPYPDVLTVVQEDFDHAETTFAGK